MRLGKFAPDNCAALHEAPGGGDLVPLGGEVERRGQLVICAAGDGHHRLRENGELHRTGGDGGVQIGGLGIAVVNDYVLTGREAVCLAEVPENKGGVLRGGVHGLAAEILKAAYLKAAVGDEVQNAAGVERDYLNSAAGLVIERRRGVCGQGGDIGRAVYQRRRDAARVRLDAEIIIERGFAVLRGIHKVCHAEAGGSVENHDVYGEVIARAL